ncbi:hypothetical protein EV193_10331 [Herbihabitans rhizosphaerae]|uniref:Uncharacterized protein n=1 Tax=Herbihabitans rhizosphaerae TaxID=1872711 RepID=A0A4Q7KWQ6_9PSEU|nr:hypothetical protein [Herbihabitans rhizosphaerae]RZS40720.1 hypothetical protein EV193_10331 [Herbihabitans rhizosphaerae]
MNGQELNVIADETSDGDFVALSNRIYREVDRDKSSGGTVELRDPLDTTAEPKRVEANLVESRFTLSSTESVGPGGGRVHLQLRTTDLGIGAPSIAFPLPAVAEDGDANGDAKPIVAALGTTVDAMAPQGWQRARIDVTATVSRMELVTQIEMADGSLHFWVPPPAISQWLHRLRMVTYRPSTGAWASAIVQLKLGEEPSIAYEYREEPQFRVREDLKSAPWRHFHDELRVLPRSPESTPDWLMAMAWKHHQSVVAAGEPERDGLPPVRGVRLLDGFDEQQRPFVYRPALTDHERELVLRYLRAAPVAVASAGPTHDFLADEHPRVVPNAYRGDGEWIWSEATAYYLENYDVSPPVEFLDHLRRRRHEPPASVPAMLLQRAAAELTGAEIPPGQAGDHRAASAAITDYGQRYRVDPSRFGPYTEVPGAWCILTEGAEYVVCFVREDGEHVDEYRFPSAMPAAAYLIGQFYLHREQVTAPAQSTVDAQA